MARFISQRLVVLFCPSCKLPMPFEDYDESGIYIGKCAICESEYEARRKSQDQNRFEIQLKRII
jgi:DNA-directed RNA polymerase subunit M/transcription elongation factor TFIIS